MSKTRMSRVCLVVATVTLLMLCAVSQATMITVNATDDTEVRGGSSLNRSTNFDGANLYAQADSVSLTRVPYIKFTLPTIPTGQTIDAVKLWLYYWASPQQTTDTVDIYKSSNTTWIESTLVWNDQTGWTHTLTENDSVPMSAGASKWHDWDLFTSTVSSGETVTLQIRANGVYCTRFQDSEHLRTPYLEVTYTPEPATMTLLLLGLPFALRRRK